MYPTSEEGYKNFKFTMITDLHTPCFKEEFHKFFIIVKWSTYDRKH